MKIRTISQPVASVVPTGLSDDAIRLHGKLGGVGEWHSRAWQLVLPRA